MPFSIGHIYRKPGLGRAAFRAHYEQHHAELARLILPRFSHYVRNHLLDCSAVDAPDCISEFGFGSDDDAREIAAILADERGRPLLEDELRFMEKARNRPYPVERHPVERHPVDRHPVERRELAERPSACAHKGVVVMDGPALQDSPWPALAEQAGLRVATVYSARGGERSWLLAWSEHRSPPERLRLALQRAGLPVRWCGWVEEERGYPRG